jgi:hypothetical protein
MTPALLKSLVYKACQVEGKECYLTDLCVCIHCPLSGAVESRVVRGW